MEADEAQRVDVVVIGAGQAGLSAAHHLARRGFRDPDGATPDDPAFVVLDANAHPGGAWQHRWESLRVDTLNGIFALPGLAKPSMRPEAPSNRAVPEYFAAFEAAEHLPLRRPVRVQAVTRADADPDGRLLVDSDAGTWSARAVVNATGTWNNPLVPDVPGRESFTGRQVHTREFDALGDVSGLRVAVVGGGISAVQHLEEISRSARTFWYTRREPVFLDEEFQPETTGRAVIARVTADVEAGLPPRSVSSYTGLAWTSYALAARDRGALVRRPMFTSVEPDGVREQDGSLTPLDAIVWATGFRADLRHLDPLGLRNELGGIRMSGTQVVDEPRVHLIGFGPSQSTVGANRAGRDAAAAVARRLGA